MRGKGNNIHNSGVRDPQAILKMALERKITPKDLVVFSHLGPHRQFLGTMHQHFEGLDYNMKVEGARVMNMPYHNDRFEDVLHYTPNYSQGAYGLYNGGVVDYEYYKALEKAALQKGIVMINPADNNSKLMLFEKYYPHIADLTAKSQVISSMDDLENMDLEYPLFVKGRIKSNKESGWDACVVKDKDELQRLATQTFVDGVNTFQESTAPQIIAREILPLKQAQAQYHNNFPMSREYRVYTHGKNILEMHYYWDDQDPFGSLTPDEYDQACELVGEVHNRLDADLKCIDLGQLKDGSWKVIEMGDPQHTGIAHMSKPMYIHKLCASLSK